MQYQVRVFLRNFDGEKEQIADIAVPMVGHVELILDRNDIGTVFVAESSVQPLADVAKDLDRARVVAEETRSALVKLQLKIDEFQQQMLRTKHDAGWEDLEW